MLPLHQLKEKVRQDAIALAYTFSDSLRAESNTGTLAPIDAHPAATSITERTKTKAHAT